MVWDQAVAGSNPVAPTKAKKLAINSEFFLFIFLFGQQFVGAFLGQLLFGTWGPILADTAIIPSILGAMVLLAIFWKRGS
ncbi:GlsB/YeaQ/YmgE family stress response membrane protein [Hoylesella shahii]|uniref:GlsB/YeaQ/YmgE family stress response membrane protein n=1 Tax=Hoylesella shahii TaxID=228603 RepID=UPI0035D08157